MLKKISEKKCTKGSNSIKFQCILLLFSSYWQPMKIISEYKLTPKMSNDIHFIKYIDDNKGNSNSLTGFCKTFSWTKCTFSSASSSLACMALSIFSSSTGNLWWWDSKFQVKSSTAITTAYPQYFCNKINETAINLHSDIQILEMQSTFIKDHMFPTVCTVIMCSNSFIALAQGRS